MAIRGDKVRLVLLTAVIGRLDGYLKSIFIIQTTKHIGKLPCEAIYKFFSSSGKDTYLLIFVPESLVTSLSNYPHQIERLLRNPEEVRQQFHQKLEELMPSIDRNKLKTALTQSQGEYKSKDKIVTIIFENSVANISSFMFSQLLLFLNEMREKTLVVDISTGHNLYVTALLEAVRGVLVFKKLNSIIHGDEDIIVKIACAPPITSENQEVQIEFHPYDVKAFFELPIKEKNINLNKLIQLSYTNHKKYSEGAKRIYKKIRKLKIHLTTGRLTYNAIKYNTPLVLFNERISGRLNQFEKIKDYPLYLYNIINALEEEHKQIQRDDNTIKITRNYRINKDFFINIHFHLALLNSIYNFWKQKVEGKDPTLQYINQTFSEVYSKLRLGLNSKFLERDCNEIFTIVNNYQGDLTYPKLLEEIRGESKDRIAKPLKTKLSDRKRNFFAHSGFSYDITKVSKRDDDILLSYDSDLFEREVESWIDNPER